jgi:hypothetical protein
MKHFVLFITLFCSAFVQAQDYIVDQYGFGGSFSSQPIKIISADDKIYLLISNLSPSLSGNLTAVDLGFNGFTTLVICLDENGNSLWQKMYGGTSGDTPTDIIDVGDGLVMSIASSSSPGTGNKTSELFTDQQFPNVDYWIVKIDYDGDIVWQKTYGSYQSDRPNSLSLTSNNNILITGYSALTEGGFINNISGNKTEPNKSRTDLWVILIDENGDEIWQKTLGVNDPNTDAIASHMGIALSNNKLFISGTTAFSGVSADKTVQSFGEYNAWLICLDESGNQLWDKVYGGNNGEINGHLLFDNFHVYYILESTSGVAGNRTTSTKGISDILIFKLDLDGNIVSQTNFGDMGITEIYSAYLYGNRIILSLIPGTEDASIDKSEDSKGGLDYWILSFDTETLDLVNEKSYGGVDGDAARSVVYFNEHLYIVGLSASGISGDKSVVNYGSTNAWILKVNPTHLLSAEEHFLFETTVYPNPTSSQINISFNEATQINKAVFYDVSGKIVLEQTFENNFESVYAINVSGLASGVYTLRLEGAGVVITRQVVVE